jgi:hypothetical protein
VFLKILFCRITLLILVLAAANVGSARVEGQELPEPAEPLWRLKEPRLEENPINLIGMSVKELFENYGPPAAVYASRGIETWQDDVVFEYTGVDFYIYKDKVWQISLDAGKGVRIGDPKAAGMLVLGEAARDNDNHILGKIPNTSWPLEWRFNIEGGKISAIYLYRMDY